MGFKCNLYKKIVYKLYAVEYQVAEVMRHHRRAPADHGAQAADAVARHVSLRVVRCVGSPLR